MPAEPAPSLTEALAAALGWWREAGVDCGFEDAPRPWIEPAAPIVEVPAPLAKPAVAAPAPPPAIGGDRAGWPQTLDDLTRWWLSEPSLDFGRVQDRVPPRGGASPALMVIVAEPEAEDRETLLSGPQGRLLAAMLAAMGERDAYIASALVRHTPMADWAALAGLGEVLRHHVSLVAPRRVIAFGAPVARLFDPENHGSPLPSHDPAQNPPILPMINHDSGSVPLMAARDLGSLLERPIAKGRFWQDWLGWSDG